MPPRQAENGRLHLTVLPQEWERVRPFECEAEEGWPRPCLVTECRYHLLDGRGAGRRMSEGGRSIDPDARPGRKPKAPLDSVTIETMPQTCAIDVAEDGPKNRREIGMLMGLNRETVRQIERRAMHKLMLLSGSEGTPPLWRWRCG